MLARLASFPHDDARIIAYAAQYVEDANNSGLIEFTDGAPPFYQIASAHVLWDAGNLHVTEDREVWVPFHFLPGNNGQEPGQALGAPMIKRLVCRKDSPLIVFSTDRVFALTFSAAQSAPEFPGLRH